MSQCLTTSDAESYLTVSGTILMLVSFILHIVSEFPPIMSVLFQSIGLVIVSVLLPVIRREYVLIRCGR